jgi:hypothetical protein
MGDYFDMESDSAGAHLAWAATFNGEEDVYYSYITVNPVPVELTSFSASITNNLVNLSWTTSTETNNRGFEIERSIDRTNWNVIGFKEGKGTSTESHYYSFSDQLTNVNSSKLFYRLKQIDFSGSFEYSNIVEAAIAPSMFSLSQNYPNPFNPSTTISYQLPANSFVTLKVYDILGKEVATLINEQKTAGKYSVAFDTPNLGSGVYFYTLRAGNYVQSKKMILAK